MDEATRKAEEDQLRQDKKEFLAKYKNETGIRWLHTYPRPPPILYFYPTEYIGQIHHVSSKYSYFTCYPPLSDSIVYTYIVRLHIISECES